LIEHTLPVPSTPKIWRDPLAIPQSAPGIFHPTRAVASLLEAYPRAVYFDEAGLSTSDVRQWMTSNAGDYLINGSGGIGWAVSAAVGGAIAREDQQVVSILGDGSSLYAAEALWSAANRGVRLLMVVLSNRRYATLNAAAAKLTGQELDLFSIEPPVIDFSGLAKLYGFDFVRACTEAELDDALASLGPRVARNTLLELVFDSHTKPVTASRHF
jgi:benzoylformate decarboxylase